MHSSTYFIWLDALWKDAVTAAVLMAAFVIGAAGGAERGMSTSPIGIRNLHSRGVGYSGICRFGGAPCAGRGLGAAFGAVATGVGFLGAGAIIKGGRSVTGLGEAGTIWCVVIIGLLLGTREFVSTVLVICLVLAVKVLLRPLATWIDRYRSGRKPEEAVLDG